MVQSHKFEAKKFLRQYSYTPTQNLQRYRLHFRLENLLHKVLREERNWIGSIVQKSTLLIKGRKSKLFFSLSYVFKLVNLSAHFFVKIRISNVVIAYPITVSGLAKVAIFTTNVGAENQTLINHKCVCGALNRHFCQTRVRCWRFIRHHWLCYSLNSEIDDFIVLLAKWQSLQTI